MILHFPVVLGCRILCAHDMNKCNNIHNVALLIVLFEYENNLSDYDVGVMCRRSELVSVWKLLSTTKVTAKVCHIPLTTRLSVVMATSGCAKLGDSNIIYFLSGTECNSGTMQAA